MRRLSGGRATTARWLWTATALAVSSGAASAQAVRGARADLVGGGTIAAGHANVFQGNDDASLGPVNIGFTLNYFGTSHTQLFVNNNGNVTFGGGTGVFTPFGLTGSLPALTGNPSINGIIAAYFGDVDTRAIRLQGSNFVSGVRPAGVGLASFSSYTSAENFGGLGRDVFSVTWSDVGYYGAHTNLTNTFQLNLINRSDTGLGLGNFDIEFNYDRVQWETGDASGGSGGFGGTPARVGYSAGTGVAGTYLEVSGSGQAGQLLDNNANSGLINNSFGSTVDGRYVFQVRNAGGGTPGETQANPALPSQVIPGDPSNGIGPTYLFRGFGNGRWADPPDTYGFQYDGVNGTLFTGVGLPTGYNAFNVCWGAGFGTCANGVASGSQYTFLSALDSFRILGINPLVDSSNPNGFPTQMFFTSATGDFNMTALIQPAVTAAPEPQTWALLGAGLLAIGGMARRRRADG